MTNRRGHFQTKTYLRWLSSKIRIPEGPTYHGLLGIMYEKEFVWVIGNDDNRIQDGRDLRLRYPGYQGDKKPIYDEPVSFLEVLVALSIRAAFMTDSDAKKWAWKLIQNLGLHRMYDELDADNEAKIHEVLETVIWRTYGPDGVGGFFPLSDPQHDQSRVEIWYQLAAYIQENHAAYNL